MTTDQSHVVCRGVNNFGNYEEKMKILVSEFSSSGA